MTTTTLAGTIATQANVYFDGKCVSHTVTLADGTRVTLDGATRLEVRLGARRRQVELVRGEAFFDVAHDAARPFLGHEMLRQLIAALSPEQAVLPAAANQTKCGFTFDIPPGDVAGPWQLRA